MAAHSGVTRQADPGIDSSRASGASVRQASRAASGRLGARPRESAQAVSNASPEAAQQPRPRARPQTTPSVHQVSDGPVPGEDGSGAFPGPQLSGAQGGSAAGALRRYGPLSTSPLNRSFFSEPPSVATLVAAVTEPALAVACLLGWAWALHGHVSRTDLVLAMVVLALSFPARDRSSMPAPAAWAELSAAWLARAGVIGLGLWVTGSLDQTDPRALAAAWACTVVLTGLFTQVSGRLAVWWQSRPHGRRRAIVIGAGSLAARVGQALRDQAGRGIDLIGCFDDRLDSRLDPGARGMRQGDLADVVDFIHRRDVQDVYITLPLGARELAAAPAAEPAGNTQGSRTQRLLQALQDTTVSVHYVPDLLGITIIQGRLRDVNGVPVVGLCETPFTGVNELVKRAEDLLLASLILVLISPLLLGVALGVKLSSPGPVLFRQRRNGLDGREIMVWKFRSMRTLDNGPVVKQATRDDPRITPFGAFIRRTSLDELPQFFNVLQGHMSIVGPRPHAVAHNDEYRELIRAYMVRHKVKPGITGWAQVNGHRGETDTLDKMRARVEYDLEYLRHWSLGLDLQIIARTVGLVLGDRHAY